MNNETQKMPFEAKAGLRGWTAVGMLIAGNALAWIDYFTPTPGDISDSVLWYFSQCLIYAGSMLGISIYVNAKIKDFFKKNSPDTKP